VNNGGEIPDKPKKKCGGGSSGRGGKESNSSTRRDESKKNSSSKDKPFLMSGKGTGKGRKDSHQRAGEKSNKRKGGGANRFVTKKVGKLKRGKG